MQIGHSYFMYGILYFILVTSVITTNNEIKNIRWSKPDVFIKTSPKYDISKQNHENVEVTTLLPKFFQPLRSRPVTRLADVTENKVPAKSSDIFSDSKIYFLRMPESSPFIYLNDFDEIKNHIQPSSFTSYNVIPPSFPVHLSLPFTSNGKPVHVYKFPANDADSEKTTLKPKITSPVINLNKGPYSFNGKPTNIYFLQDSFNSLFVNALSNFYP